MIRNRNLLHPSVAAERLGISIDCVYERIRRGELLAQKDGDRWAVVVDPVPPPVDHVDPPAPLDAAPRPAEHGRVDAHAPYQVTSLRTLASQLAAQGLRIDQIQAQLELLQTSTPVTPATPVSPPAMPAEATPQTDARLVVTRHANRPRPRFFALAAIVALVLAGIAIQESSAQRSDDMTVAFVFACGAVTGAVAAWLALDNRRAPAAGIVQKAAGRAEPSPERPIPQPAPAIRPVAETDR